MQNSVLNKQGKFGVKILWRYTDIAIFVLRCFILTHPVHTRPMNDINMAPLLRCNLLISQRLQQICSTKVDTSCHIHVTSR